MVLCRAASQKPGDLPNKYMKPKRWKGYWRAVRSKKPWALKIHKYYEKGDMLQWLLHYYYDEDLMKEALFSRNWLLDNLPKTEGPKGGYLPIPFNPKDKK